LGTVHRQKGFHHGHRNFGGFERNHSTVAADDLVMAQAGVQGGRLGGIG
jgi:hypothetical protein